MKNKRMLAGPYLFWSVSFVVIPLLVIVYYAFTSDEGTFTFSNLAQITTPEKSEGSGNVPASVIFEYTDLSGSCVSTCNDPEPETGQSDKFYCSDFYFTDVDELSSPYTGMADTA